MKIRTRIGFIILCGAAACAVLMAGCRVTYEQPGSLAVKDAAPTSEDVSKGFIATVDCSPAVSAQGGTHVTEVGTVSYQDVTLVNDGTADVTINGAEFILLNAAGELTTHEQDYFSWARQPDLPLTLAAGKSVTFTVAFTTVTAGTFSACLNINTTDGYQQVRLSGEGGWAVTLVVAAGANGKITSPVTVTTGQSFTYLSVESTITLAAETTDKVSLTELKYWAVTGGATVKDIAALTTTATISAAVTIEAIFNTPYIFVSAGGSDSGAGNLTTAPFLTLEHAIAQYTATGTGGYNEPDANGVPKYKGIVMESGSYTLAAAVALPQCMLRGGYDSGFATRAEATYKTADGRAAGTRINTAGYDFTYSGAITSAAIMEGIQVTAKDGTTGLYAAFGVVGGAAPTLRYCTFIGGGGAATNSIGLYIYGSSPTVDTCVIKGSDTTADRARSVGLWTTYSCAPTVTACVISGGKASSAGKSYGVFNSSYGASPIVQGCTIDGGSGSSLAAAIWTGEGGRPRIEGNTLFTQDDSSASRYGVYIYSNGRLESLFGNNIYGCPDALVFDYSHEKTYTTIDSVNDDFLDDDQEENTSVAQ